LVGRSDADVEEANAGIQLFGYVVPLTSRPANCQRQTALGQLGDVRGGLV